MTHGEIAHFRIAMPSIPPPVAGAYATLVDTADAVAVEAADAVRRRVRRVTTTITNSTTTINATRPHTTPISKDDDSGDPVPPDADASSPEDNDSGNVVEGDAWTVVC